MIALEVSHLNKSYGSVKAVDDLSFQVSAGEVYGLVGPNGAGKTTTMMMIIGLMQQDQGTIRLGGQNFNVHDPEMRAQLGFAPQDVSVYPGLSALQNLRFFGRLYGLRGVRLNDRLDQILELTGLRENADHKVASFSGGMKRRLNFGVALIHEPKFVVLDEPTVGVDPQSRSHLLDSVRELGRQSVGVVYATHYMEEVEAVCQRVGIMDRGKLLRQGTLDEMLDRQRMNVCIRVQKIPSPLLQQLRELAHVATESDGLTTLVIDDSSTGLQAGQSERLRRVLDILDNARVPISSIETREESLEQLFLQLTGRSLRD